MAWAGLGGAGRGGGVKLGVAFFLVLVGFSQTSIELLQ